ncbi:MAG: hypothetical protein EOP48_34305 [Sphingobacteriales bacterium]|nr:MAG: hypothetical protein EOP48_34305 [Sphingobacteriales bacterium]
MITYIKNKEITYAIIIGATYKSDDIKFFTPGDYSQQLGYMNRPKGYIIKPHVHKHLERKVTLTQEVLYVKTGKVRVDFYTEDKLYFESVVISTGDVILLATGGHGFEMLEPTEMIEIKQGPYAGENDKVRFVPSKN